MSVAAQPSLEERFERALRTAKQAMADGDARTAFAHLEIAHVLGQKRTRLHVRAHVAMLAWAWARRDRREWFGQIFRIIAAALITWIWVPEGNTGGANVSALAKPQAPLNRNPGEPK